jgi:hypothetical protein
VGFATALYERGREVSLFCFVWGQVVKEALDLGGEFEVAADANISQSGVRERSTSCTRTISNCGRRRSRPRRMSKLKSSYASNRRIRTNQPADLAC